MKTSLSTKAAAFVIAFGIVTVAVSAVFTPAQGSRTGVVARSEAGSLSQMSSAAVPRVIVVGKRLSSVEKAVFDSAARSGKIR